MLITFDFEILALEAEMERKIQKRVWYLQLTFKMELMRLLLIAKVITEARIRTRRLLRSIHDCHDTVGRCFDRYTIVMTQWVAYPDLASQTHKITND